MNGSLFFFLLFFLLFFSARPLKGIPTKRPRFFLSFPFRRVTNDHAPRGVPPELKPNFKIKTKLLQCFPVLKRKSGKHIHSHARRRSVSSIAEFGAVQASNSLSRLLIHGRTCLQDMLAPVTHITTSLNIIGLKSSCLGDPDGSALCLVSLDHSGEIEIFTNFTDRKGTFLRCIAAASAEKYERLRISKSAVTA